MSVPAAVSSAINAMTNYFNPPNAIEMELRVLRAQDKSMQMFKLNMEGNLRGLCAVNEKVIWTSGQGGFVAHTINGGITWHYTKVDEKLDFRAVCAFDAWEACAMSAGLGQDGHACIFRTMNGGQQWQCTFQTDMKDVFMNAMSFWDKSHGIVLCDPIDGEFVLFNTSDGGCSWKPLKPLQMPKALENESVFAASNSCLTVEGAGNAWFATGCGAVARIFYTNDRGLHWDAVETPIIPSSIQKSAGIFSVAFRNDKEGIAVGGDHKFNQSFPGHNIIVTSDGGKSWLAKDSGNLSGHYLSCVTWLSGAAAMVVDGSSEFSLHSVVYKDGSVWASGKGTVVRIIL